LKRQSFFLKSAIFATGVSGLVAEFIFSTLASYFIGDTIVQWTVVLSIMLFSMGVGSRLSSRVEKDLLSIFLSIEIGLSLLICLSPLFIYGLAGFTQYIHIFIYTLAALVGCAIGFEIPLVIRLNEGYEGLNKNISSIMSYDYVGSLVGGLAFAFIGLPFLGIKNSAFLFGMFNLLAALTVVIVFWEKLKAIKLRVGLSMGLAFFILSISFIKSDSIKMYGEQSRFKDKIVHVVESKYQKLVVTKWLQEHWLYINGNLQMTTLDEYLYHEPMIHPVMSLVEDPKNILIIGGGDGFNAKELLKYEAIETIDLVDLDPEMTKLGAAFPSFVKANLGSLSHPKLTVLNEDGFVFLQESNSFYDLIVIDLPDAKGVDLSKLYSKEFYQMIRLHLRSNGYMVTQSGNPYLATRAFECIKKTMQNVGFNIAPIHNHVLSMGEWSWVIGAKDITSVQLKIRLEQGTYGDIETRWLNQESVKMMLNFGKPLEDTAGVQVNTINNPVLYQYQLNGNWGHY
tara:strand:+ start:61573 stop:63105 length:1533 start_codon:yes stop_codon:yes gene_type:complete